MPRPTWRPSLAFVFACIWAFAIYAWTSRYVKHHERSFVPYADGTPSPPSPIMGGFTRATSPGHHLDRLIRTYSSATDTAHRHASNAMAEAASIEAAIAAAAEEWATTATAAPHAAPVVTASTASAAPALTDTNVGVDGSWINVHPAASLSALVTDTRFGSTAEPLETAAVQEEGGDSDHVEHNNGGGGGDDDSGVAAGAPHMLCSVLGESCAGCGKPECVCQQVGPEEFTCLPGRGAALVLTPVAVGKDGLEIQHARELWRVRVGPSLDAALSGRRARLGCWRYGFRRQHVVWRGCGRRPRLGRVQQRREHE